MLTQTSLGIVSHLIALSHHNLRQDEGEKTGNWGDLGHMEPMVLFSYSYQTFSAGSGCPSVWFQLELYQQQIVRRI